MDGETSTVELLATWRDELVAADLIDDGPWPPASGAEPGDLDRAEARLGRSFPPSYREFLSLADGWPVTGALVAGLRSAGQVGWFRDLEAEWLQIWHDIDPEDGGPGGEVALMRRALLVSVPGDQALLLDPDDVDPLTGEWACLTFSNWAPGSHRVGGSFRDGLVRLIENCREFNPPAVAPPPRAQPSTTTEEVYQALRAGDLGARELLDDLVADDRRAFVLAAQFDAFGAPATYDETQDLSMRLDAVWNGARGAETIDEFVLEELLPYQAVRLVELGFRGSRLMGAVRAAPPVVGDRLLDLLQQIEQRTGPVADFSYAPAFAVAVDEVRRLVRAGALDAAWQALVVALPSWEPRSPQHLVPLGVYSDRDVRRLLRGPAGTPAAPSPGGGPGDLAHGIRGRRTVLSGAIAALPAGKEHSDRTITVLRAVLRSRSA